MDSEKKTKTEKTEVRKFTKEQLLASKRFSDRKDLINALLLENKKYSIEEADKKITEFLKGKVK